MTVGNRIAGGTDLDAVFAARVSAAAANVGFKDSSGVDLSNRYEPRGAATPIGNTGYRNSAGTDLAQIYKALSAITATSHTLTAGSYFQSTNSTTHSGFGVAAVVVTGQPAFGSISPNTVGSNTLVGFWWSDDGDTHVVFEAGSTPADSDATWQSVNVTGVFQGGGSSVTKTLNRAAAFNNTTTATRRRWNFVGADMAFASGNSYSVTFNRV